MDFGLLDTFALEIKTGRNYSKLEVEYPYICNYKIHTK